MITRRLFASALAGLAAAKVSTVGFVQHRILRRPYRFDYTFPPKPYWLYDALFMRATILAAPLRVKGEYPGGDESVFEVSTSPRPGERFMLLGVHGWRAELPLKVSVESRKPFHLSDLLADFMRPNFRRVDGMIVFHDPFYKPVQESEWQEGPPRPHHRKLYGPGKDIGYLG